MAEPPPNEDATRIAAPRPAANAAMQVGDVLAHTYRLEALLGRGGMGAVYRASHVALGTQHAIKIILPEYAHDPYFVALIEREARSLHRVRDDAVVEYQGLFLDEEGRRYLVMEYVDGVSLAAATRERALGIDEVRRLKRRLARGLAAAHAQGVFHRDLSPDNVILPGGDVDRAKIIDFGIAKSGDGSATLIGTEFAGKYSFVSPEQAGLNGGMVDARSDIYSLGLVLAAAAIGKGRKLPMGDSPASVVTARQSVPDLTPVPAELRAELRPLLEPLPERRPASMSDLLGGTPAAAAPARRRAPVLALSLGGSALAAAGVVAFMLLAPSRSPVPAGTAPEPTSSPTAAPAPAADPSVQKLVEQLRVPAAEPVPPASAETPPAQVASAPAPPAETPPRPQAIPAAAPPTTDAAVETAARREEPPRPQATPAAALPAETSPAQAVPPATAPADTSPAPAIPAAAPPATDAQVETAARRDEPPPRPAPPDAAALTAALGKLECGALSATANANTIRVAGIVPAAADAMLATGRLEARFPSFRIENEAREAAPPFCAPLAALWRSGALDAAAPVRLELAKRRWTEGEAFSLGVESSAAAPVFLQVSLVDNEGTVVHLLPTPRTADNVLGAGAKRQIGSARRSGGEVFEVAPPFGQNLLLVVAASEPLFAEKRPQVENVAAFLPALEAALARGPARAAWEMIETLPPAGGKAGSR